MLLQYPWTENGMVPVVLRLEWGNCVQVICTECGHPFDDDQCCYECVARDEAIAVTFRIALPAALFGFWFGSAFADDMYRPLVDHLSVLLVPGISLVLALALAFLLQDQLTRYWILSIFLIIFVAATFLYAGAYDFLNGFLDRNPATEITTQVLGKGVNPLRRNGQFIVLTLPLNGERVNVEIIVNTRVFNAVKPGDSVHLLLHPGAFSLPWHDDGCPCSVSSR
jgi:hypothetical protein